MLFSGHKKLFLTFLEGQERQGWVFHTKRPECVCGEEGANPEQLRPRGVGPEGWWGEVSSRGNSVGYRVSIGGLKNCYQHFGRSNTAKVGGRGGGFDGRRPKSSNKHKQQQK